MHSCRTAQHQRSFATVCFMPFFDKTFAIAAITAATLIILGMGCDARPHDEPDSGSTVQSCSPSNCDGCCEQGVCRTGSLDGTCGRSGAACIACTMLQACTSGQCVAKPTVDAGIECGPANCAGCCSWNGRCETVDNATCGVKGSRCVDCGEDICNRPSGKCLSLTSPCDASTCTGCCTAGGVCVAKINQNNGQCGHSGGACRVCTPSATQTCDVDTGSCVAKTLPCGVVDCEGCCDSAQVCRSGFDSAACGWAGATCQACVGGTTCRGPPSDGTLAHPCR